MAERRMFAKSVIDSDEFLDMPQEAQLLYFHLSMRADDDGFITPKKVMRLIGAREDALKILIAKSFIRPFDSGVIVIKHWAINNLIRKDRYTPTIYQTEKQSLSDGIPAVNQRLTQDSIGKDRVVQDSIDKEDSLRSSSCSEPSAEDSEPDPVFTTIIDRNDKEVPVCESLVKKYEDAYPSINVRAEIMKARAWCASVSKNERKIDITKFLNNWLKRAFEHAPVGGSRPSGRVGFASTNAEIRAEREAMKKDPRWKGGDITGFFMED